MKKRDVVEIGLLNNLERMWSSGTMQDSGALNRKFEPS